MRPDLEGGGEEREICEEFIRLVSNRPKRPTNQVYLDTEVFIYLNTQVGEPGTLLQAKDWLATRVEAEKSCNSGEEDQAGQCCFSQVGIVTS